MPKKTDPKVKEGCDQQMLEHVSEYPNPTAAAGAVDNGVAPSVGGATTEELAEIRELKAKVRRVEEDNDILRRASIFFAGELDPRGR